MVLSLDLWVIVRILGIRWIYEKQYRKHAEPSPVLPKRTVIVMRLPFFSTNSTLAGGIIRLRRWNPLRGWNPARRRMGGFNFIRVSGFHLRSRFHPCDSKDFMKRCPTRSDFPAGHFAFFRLLSHYKSLELWVYRWICGVIVRLMRLHSRFRRCFCGGRRLWCANADRWCGLFPETVKTDGFVKYS